MEGKIAEQVKQIFFKRSVLYPETLPNGGNRPIFPDRKSYVVQIQRINNILWVELLREEFPIDAFEIIIEGDHVTCIEHSMSPDSFKTNPTNYKRTVVGEFNISGIEFLSFQKREERRSKLFRLFGIKGVEST